MNDTLICYCFGYTEDDIRNDYLKNGKSLIRERIAAEKKDGNCKCAETNPNGRWCLADVNQVVNVISGDKKTLDNF